MGKKRSVIGEVFGRLTVITDRQTTKRIRSDGKTIYDYLIIVKCECGVIKQVSYPDINRKGGAISCGCYRHDFLVKKNTTKSGLSRGREYWAWYGMKKRCYDTKCQMYYRYGGRGITVCERWMNSIDNFVEDMGMGPGVGYSIEREDNDGNYEPGNCKWATDLEQSNNRSSNILFTIDGVTKNLTQWCIQYNVKYATVWQRSTKMGWDIIKSLTYPIRDIKFKNGHLPTNLK